MPKYKPVIVYVDPEEWPQFQEACGSQRVSARIRELISKDLAGTRQAKRSLANR